VALGARVVLESAGGKREIELEEFITGPGRTQLKPDELLTAIVVRKMKPGERCMYRKLGQRKALAISIASVAVRFELDEGTRTCGNPGIAFGAVAPVIRRVKELEDLLGQKKLDDQAITDIAAAAKKYSVPISDIRASADYRREMCCSLLYEALFELAS
jgi:xanthine dehydrogenase FAD-binding subunit